MLPLGEVWNFKSSEQDFFSNLVYSLGASVGLGDGDLDGCTSCVGNSDDVVTFFFHTCLVCGLDLGEVGSSFTGVGNSVR
jgi:hypothetical protein